MRRFLARWFRSAANRLDPQPNFTWRAWTEQPTSGTAGPFSFHWAPDLSREDD